MCNDSMRRFIPFKTFVLLIKCLMTRLIKVVINHGLMADMIHVIFYPFFKNHSFPKSMISSLVLSYRWIRIFLV